MHKGKITQKQRITVIDLAIPEDPAIVNVHWNDIMRTAAMQDMAEAIQHAMDIDLDRFVHGEDDLDY